MITDDLTRKKTIDEIVKEAEELDQMELQILLTKLQVRIMHRATVKPVSNASKKIKLPKMEDIDQWKHESGK